MAKRKADAPPTPRALLERLVCLAGKELDLKRPPIEVFHVDAGRDFPVVAAGWNERQPWVRLGGFGTVRDISKLRFPAGMSWRL